MFARRLKVEVSVEGERRACPLDWLDSFCMRRFTGDAAFDDTLPQAEGVLEAGFRVNSDRLAEELVEAEPVELHEQVKELADNLEAEA